MSRHRNNCVTSCVTNCSSCAAVFPPRCSEQTGASGPEAWNPCRRCQRNVCECRRRNECSGQLSCRCDSCVRRECSGRFDCRCGPCSERQECSDRCSGRQGCRCSRCSSRSESESERCTGRSSCRCSQCRSRSESERCTKRPDCRCSRCKKQESNDSDSSESESESRESRCESESRESRCESKSKKKKSCNKCFSRRCRCIETFDSLRTRCGCLAARLTKTAEPLTFTAAGQVITYTFTITNVGTAVISHPIQICDSFLGGQFVCIFLYPGQNQEIIRTYTTTQQDVQRGFIHNETIAFILVSRCKRVRTNCAETRVTLGSADVSGTLSQVTTTLNGNQTPNGGIVTATITNSALSATPALGITLFLPFPAGVSVANTVAGAAVGPASAPVVGASGVTISEPSIPVGTTYQYTFTYGPVASGAYNWAGTIQTESFDPNPTNNGVSSTLII